MKKFLLVLILILSLTLLLSACGGTDPDGEKLGGGVKPTCTHNYVVTQEPEYECTGNIQCSICCTETNFPALSDERVTVESRTANETIYKYTTDDGYTVKLTKSNFSFAEDDDGYRLVKYIGDSANVVIPSTYKNKPVVAVGSYDDSPVFENASLVSVTIPDSVTDIRTNIFSKKCTSLTELTLPAIEDSVYISSMVNGPDNYFKKITISSGTAIGFALFSSCENLEDIYLPSTITKVGYDALLNCDNLKNIYFNGTLAQYCNISFIETAPSSNMFFAYADNVYFKNASNEYYTIGDTLIIPDGVTAIKDAAFSHLGAKTIIIPDSVTTIGTYSFQFCENLQTIVFGSGLSSVGKNGFYNSSSIETVYFKGTSSQWNGVSVDNSDSPSNYYIFQADKYYYSEEGDLFAYASGKEYWHFDEDGMPVFWTFNITDTVDGKSFTHSVTEIDISDTYWSMLEQAEAEGMLEFVLDPQTLFFYQNSADKAEFQQKVTENLNNSYASLVIEFSNGKIIGMDPYPASYVEVDGDKIYKTQTEEIIFTIDEDGNIVWDNSNEYITAVSTFTVND